MEHTKRTTEGPRVFAYRGILPGGLGLLLLAPLLLVMLPLALGVLASGTVGAMLLARFMRGRVGTPQDPGAIELRCDQYTRVDDPPRRLPPA